MPDKFVANHHQPYEKDGTHELFRLCQ